MLNATAELMYLHLVSEIPTALHEVQSTYRELFGTLMVVARIQCRKQLCCFRCANIGGVHHATSCSIRVATIWSRRHNTC